jgi:polysaccharide biosynthesis transport protein
MSVPEDTNTGAPVDATIDPADPIAREARTGRPGTHTGRPVAPPAALISAPNLLTLLRALRRRWVLASSLGLSLGTVAAVAVWFLLPPAKNTANVQLLMSSEKDGLVHKHPDDVGESFEAYQSKQVHYIRSRMVINTALRQPGVAQLATFRNVKDPIEWLEREIRVDFPSREILRITVSGEELDDLKTLAEAIKKAYLSEVIEKQTKERQTRLEELRKIQTKYKDKLASNRRVKAELAKKTQVGDARTLGLVMMMMQEQLKSAQTQLMTTRDQIRQMEVTEALTSGRADQATTDQMVASYMEKEPGITSHIQMIAEMEELYERSKKAAKDPSNPLPGLKQIRDKIDAERIMLEAKRSRVKPQLEARVRENIQQHMDYDSTLLKRNLGHAKALEKSLMADIDKFRRTIEDAPGAQVSFQEMEFDIEQAENEVRTVTAEINHLEVEMNDPARVRPLQEAVAYKVDNFARKVQMSGAAGVACLGLALVGVAFLEFRSRRVSTVDEVTQGLGVRVVGTVPACPRRVRNGVTGGGKSSYWKSILAESVDAARTLLLHHARREDLRIIMVTSASGGEGKTSLSSHLAVSMARSGRKTLLIDCDLRNPSAHKLFSVALEPGLSSVLRNEIPIEDALHATQATGLWLMPAGACDGEALTMLAQDGMQVVFDRLRADFDFIIVDSSPVLPVADSLMVAQQVDGVLFAILREVSRLPKVHEAYQKLVTLGVRMLGAVVNGTTSEIYGYGYNNARYLTATKK